LEEDPQHVRMGEEEGAVMGSNGFPRLDGWG